MKHYQRPAALILSLAFAASHAYAAALSSRDWADANMIRTTCGGDLECVAGVISLARSQAVFDALTAACGKLPDAATEMNACWQRGLAAAHAQH